MFTTGSKWFYGIAAGAFFAALVYGVATGDSAMSMDHILGVLTFGYKGGVGDHLGYAILMGTAGGAAFVGSSIAAFRDADHSAISATTDREVGPLSAPNSSYLPIIGAFGATVAALGLAVDKLLVLLGIVIISATVLEWTLSVWAERATDDPEVNAGLRRRLMLPVEVPLIGAIGVGVFVLAASRVLLALPKSGVYIVFAGVPLLVLAATFVFASKPKLNRSLVAAVVVVGALALLAGGVAGAIAGPHETEHEEHEEEHGAYVEPLDVVNLDSASHGGES